MIALMPHSDGVVLQIKAQPGARKAEIRGEQDGSLKVAVTQVAEKGKANRALLDVLSRQLQLRKSQLEWLRGETSQHKRLLVRGISPAELQTRLQALLGPVDHER